jgi:hypothetical protein
MRAIIDRQREMLLYPLTQAYNTSQGVDVFEYSLILAATY